MSSNILLIAETMNNQISSNSAELSGLASRLSSTTDDQVKFLVPGSDISSNTETFASQTGHSADVFENPAFRYSNPELTADTVVKLAGETAFDYICFLHTATGCQAAAKTAALTGTACISAVNSVRMEGQDIVFQRALFNGKLAMDTMPTTRPVVLTALPGAFSQEHHDQDLSEQPVVTVKQMDTPSVAYQPLGITTADDSDTAIDKADIIIAAGRGIGDEENLELVNRLARLFPNAAVAASRPLCDLKWLPYSRQVGATGKTVSPKLYLACGISGAQQHVYGMKDAQWIVAVNTDPNAAIFSVADFCIVEDVTSFLPILADMYEKH